MDRPIEKKQWPTSKIMTYVVVGLAIIGAGYTVFGTSSKSSLTIDADRISIARVAQASGCGTRKQRPDTTWVIEVESSFAPATTQAIR